MDETGFNLQTLIGMRNTVMELKRNLTPYSSKSEYLRYYESILHYKKVLNLYLTRTVEDIDKEINKSYTILRNFKVPDNEEIKRRILDGGL